MTFSSLLACVTEFYYQLSKERVFSVCVFFNSFFFLIISLRYNIWAKFSRLINTFILFFKT